MSKTAINPLCYLGVNGVYEGDMPACEGRLIRAHLIPKQVILRELPSEESAHLIWDARCWVWACGGIMGNAGHHGAFDSSKRLRLTRDKLPKKVEIFAEEHDLEWYLDRTYGLPND